MVLNLIPAITRDAVAAAASRAEYKTPTNFDEHFAVDVGRSPRLAVCISIRRAGTTRRVRQQRFRREVNQTLVTDGIRDWVGRKSRHQKHSAHPRAGRNPERRLQPPTFWHWVPAFAGDEAMRPGSFGSERISSFSG